VTQTFLFLGENREFDELWTFNKKSIRVKIGSQEKRIGKESEIKRQS